MTVECNVLRAFTKSVKRIQVFYRAAWKNYPILEIENHTDFFASIVRSPSLIVRVSTGCVQAIVQLQKNCLAAFDVESALEWLILHELHHADLAHFEILEGNPSLHLVTRLKHNAALIAGLPSGLRHKIPPCLELQADHDALEMLLDGYSSGKWNRIRTRAVSVAAVLILIEKTDDGDGDKPSTHPRAATRIFQLLGHVVEMWSIPAHAKAKVRDEGAIRDEDLPSQEEIQAFSNEVVLPVFWAAVALAEAAEAKSIVADLGSPEVFFEDIGRAKLGQWDELVTVGAKEWAELKELNASVLENLGHSSI